MTKLSTVPASLPEPLTKQKIEDMMSHYNKGQQDSCMLLSVLLAGLLLNVLLFFIYDSEKLETLYIALAFTHAYFLFSLGNLNLKYDKTNIKNYSPINIESYNELLALKNQHSAIADYINKVAIDGREILNVELKLFIDYAKKCDEGKKHSDHEQAKKEVYSCESNLNHQQ